MVNKNDKLTIDIVRVILSIPSKKKLDIAKHLAVSPATITYHIKKALKKGWIKQDSVTFKTKSEEPDIIEVHEKGISSYKPGISFIEIKESILKEPMLGGKTATSDNIQNINDNLKIELPDIHKLEFKVNILTKFNHKNTLHKLTNWHRTWKASGTLFFMRKLTCHGLAPFTTDEASVVLCWGKNNRTMHIFLPAIWGDVDNFKEHVFTEAKRLAKRMKDIYYLHLGREVEMCTDPHFAFPKRIYDCLELGGILHIELDEHILIWLDRSQGHTERECSQRNIVRKLEYKELLPLKNEQDIGKISARLNELLESRLKSEAQMQSILSLLHRIDGQNAASESARQEN